MEKIMLETTLVLLFSTFANVIVVFFTTYYFNRKSRATDQLTMSALQIISKNFITEVRKVHTRIDQIFTVDKPSPNEATKATTEGEDFSEMNILDPPKDLKFEVEGGDTHIPPEFSEAN